MTASTSTYEHQLALADRFLGAWNTHDVEQTVACYTPDVRYLEVYFDRAPLASLLG